MDFQYDADDLAFREEVRAFLQTSLPDDLREKTVNSQALSRDDIMRWHRILHGKGWVAPNWPAEYGGPGWSVTQKYIFDEEAGRAGAPRLIQFGLGMCGPVLMAFGTDEQRPSICRACCRASMSGPRVIPNRAPGRTSRACAPAPGSRATNG